MRVTTTKKPTFALQISQRPNRTGMWPIYLRITKDRKVTRHKTLVEVKKVNWNKDARNSNWVRPADPDYQRKNEMLKHELGKAQEAAQALIDAGMPATGDSITSIYANASESDLFFSWREPHDGEAPLGTRRSGKLVYSGFAYDKTQELYDAGGIANWKKTAGFLNKLAAFLKKNHSHELYFNELTPEFVDQFKAYLDKLRNSRSVADRKRKLHPNTIAVIMIRFKAIVNKAIELGKISPEKNPFLSYKIEQVATDKEKLTAEEIHAIEALALVPGSVEDRARDCFMFSFYCAGIRVGDLLQLRWANVEDGRLTYRMSKNHKGRDLQLVPQALDILAKYRTDAVRANDYIFPFLDSRAGYAEAITLKDRDTMPPEAKRHLLQSISAKTALLNKFLKKVAAKAGITKPVSMHVARHSFAKYAVEAGVQINDLQSILGHTNSSTTQHYVGQLSTARADKTMTTVFEAPAPQPVASDKSQLLQQLKALSPEQLQALLHEVTGTNIQSH